MRKASGAVLVLTLGILLFAQAPNAWACSCAGPVSDEATFEQAEIVFIGEAVARRDPNAGKDVQSTGDPITWTFDAASVQKGMISDPQEVVTARDGATCGFGFVKGHRYQVYAWTDETGALNTGLCAGNRDLADQEPYREDDPLAGAKIKQASSSPKPTSPTPEKTTAPGPAKTVTRPSQKATPVLSLTASPIAAPAPPDDDRGPAGPTIVAGLLLLVTLGLLLRRALPRARSV